MQKLLGVNERKQVGAVGGALCRLRSGMGKLGDRLSWAPGVWDRRVMREGPWAEVTSKHWAHQSSAQPGQLCLAGPAKFAPSAS